MKYQLVNDADHTSLRDLQNIDFLMKERQKWLNKAAFEEVGSQPYHYYLTYANYLKDVAIKTLENAKKHLENLVVDTTLSC